jgi:hypothetical protein
MDRISSFILAFGLTSALFVLGSAQAAIIYVDNDATCPGAGTSASPYCTIQRAVTAAVAGDNIRLRFGTGAYNERVVAATSGTSDNHIVIESDDHNNQPRWYYAGNGSTQGAFEFNNKNYWTLQYLNFDGTGISTPRFSVWYSGTNHRILHNTFKNWGGTTDAERSGMGATAINSAGLNALIQDNVFSGMPRAMEVWHGGATIDRNEFTNITCQSGSEGNVAIAIHMLGLYDGFDPQNNIFSNNTFHDFQRSSGCTLTGGTAWMAAMWADDKVLNNQMIGNHIYNLDPDKAPGHDVIGIFLENASHGWIVTDNLIYDVAIGIDHSDHSTPPDPGISNNRYANNTIYNIGDSGIRVRSGHATIRNNIVSGAALRQIYVYSNATTEGGLDIDYNDYWNSPDGAKVGVWGGGSVLTFSSWKTACNCDAHSLNSDPLFVNPPSDLHLQPSSPARGAGEGGVDMGAYVLSPPANLRVIQIFP